MEAPCFSTPEFPTHVGNLGKLPQDRVQEPAQPNAFSLAMLADTVHAVIPVAGAHQRKAMTSDIQAAIQRARAMFEQGCAVTGTVRLKIRFQLSGSKFITFQEWNQFVEDL